MAILPLPVAIPFPQRDKFSPFLVARNTFIRSLLSGRFDTCFAAGPYAVGLGDPNYARLFREETGITFPLLVDTERTAYRAAQLRSANLFHLLRHENAEARARARRAGHRQHRLGKNPFQLGASFILAPAIAICTSTSAAHSATTQTRRRCWRSCRDGRAEGGRDANCLPDQCRSMT